MQFGGKTRTKAKAKEKAKTSKEKVLHGMLHHGVRGGARDAAQRHITQTDAASTMSKTTRWKLMVETQLQKRDIGQTNQDRNGWQFQQWKKILHHSLRLPVQTLCQQLQ